MPSQPCINKITCDCENTPFVNLSSEAPDIPDFFSLGYAQAVPPLGTDFTKLDCLGLCVAPTQQGADLCAYLAALECITTFWQPPGDGSAQSTVPPPVRPPGRGRFAFFLNTEQDATVNCPDGLPFSYIVPAGKFGGFSQAQANTAAQSYGVAQAQLHLLCLSGIQASVCAGTPYNATITASSLFLAHAPGGDVWELTSGALPPGIDIPEFIFTTGIVTGGVIHLQGTCSNPGVYNFSIGITLPNGDSFNKPYQIKVAGITNSLDFADATPNTPYSQNIESLGVTNPIYSLDGGALPDGLALDSTGVIFGTPTVPGAFIFTLGVTEAGTGITCEAPGEILVAGNFNWNANIWIDNPFAPASPDFTVTIFSGSHVKFFRNLNDPGTGQTGAVITGNNPDLTMSYEGTPVTASIKVIYNDSIFALSGWIVNFWDNADPSVDPPTSSFTGQVIGTFNFPINITGGAGGKVSVGVALPGALAGNGASVEVILTPAS